MNAICDPIASGRGVFHSADLMFSYQFVVCRCRRRRPPPRRGGGRSRSLLGRRRPWSSLARQAVRELNAAAHPCAQLREHLMPSGAIKALHRMAGHLKTRVCGRTSSRPRRLSKTVRRLPARSVRAAPQGAGGFRPGAGRSRNRAGPPRSWHECISAKVLHGVAHCCMEPAPSAGRGKRRCELGRRHYERPQTQRIVCRTAAHLATNGCRRAG